MKTALLIDLDGNLIPGAEIVDDNAPDITERHEPDPENPGELVIVGYTVAKQPTGQIFKHVWDFETGDWKEGLTPEELDAAKNPPPPPKTPEQLQIEQLQADKASLRSDLDDLTLMMADLIMA